MKSPSNSPNSQASNREQRARKLSSQNQSPAGDPNWYTAESANNSAVSQQAEITFTQEPRPGSFDDASVVRGILNQSIKESGKSRQAICEEMEFLLGRTFTLRMLDGFTADSRNDRRFPVEFERAFCKATGDNTLLACRAQMSGLHVINEEEMMLLDLGRQFLIRNQAEEKIALLQKRLHGRIG